MPANTSRNSAFWILAVVVIIVALVGWRTNAAPANSCNVAYIKLQGELFTYLPGDASSTDAFDQTASDDVTQSIRDASADPSIKAVILAIDSPGGDPVAGEEIESTLRDVKKPTVALIRSEGDSAAYMSASGADTIFASDFSDVGDIGITESYTDQAKQDVAEGITFNQLSIGKYKDMFDTDKPLTPDEKALVMSNLQVDYQHFIQTVATNRHMSVAKVTALADGSSLGGEAAVQAGLIDKIGNVDDVRTYLTQQLNTQAVICSIDTD